MSFLVDPSDTISATSGTRSATAQTRTAVQEEETLLRICQQLREIYEAPKGNDSYQIWGSVLTAIFHKFRVQPEAKLVLCYEDHVYVTPEGLAFFNNLMSKTSPETRALFDTLAPKLADAHEKAKDQQRRAMFAEISRDFLLQLSPPEMRSDRSNTEARIRQAWKEKLFHQQQVAESWEQDVLKQQKKLQNAIFRREQAATLYAQTQAAFEIWQNWMETDIDDEAYARLRAAYDVQQHGPKGKGK